MNENLLTALQDQFNMERQNAAIYDALAAQLDAVHWPGASAWMKRAADEERQHADKFSGYIVDRNGVPQFAGLVPVVAPQETDDLVLFFDAAMGREQLTTEAIKALHVLADEAEDPQTCAFLIWFLEEQTKSEREITDILLMLNRLDNNGRVVFDETLGEA